MPRLLRLLGAQLAFVWTLLYVWLAWVLLAASLPFIYGFLLPLFAGTLAVIALSYLFVSVVEIAGAGGSPPSPFVNVCAVIYLIACTAVAVPAVFAAGVFTVTFAPLLLLIGVAALLLFLLPHAMQVLLGYVLAATFAPRAPFNPTAGTGGVDSPAECFFRGTLVGMNTAMNGVLGIILYGMLFLPAAAALGSSSVLAIQPAALPIALGVGVTLTLMLATFGTSLASATVAPAIPLSGFVQGFVEAHAGWLSWLMPMSWYYCAYGWWRFYSNWAGHFMSMMAPGSFPPATWAIVAVRLNSASGSISTDSGVQSNNGSLAYNNGCFSFVSLGLAGQSFAREHEAGHHLNLAAFGAFFGWINATNEHGYGPISAQGVFAYGERVAESNVSPPVGAPEVPVWR